MTRKDFVMIAKVFHDLDADFNNGGEDTVSLALVAEELALKLRDVYPNFNFDRFIVACKAVN
jgi:hypothetical protein